MDEKTGVMTSSGWISMSWVDEYISWDPRDFMGLEVGLQSRYRALLNFKRESLLLKKLPKLKYYYEKELFLCKNKYLINQDAGRLYLVRMDLI